jgi:hypothetical protein
MAARRKVADGQLSIFDVIQKFQGLEQASPAPGSFNLAARLREMLTEGLRQCSFSRYEAAARMSELVGAEITKSMLDSWTAESKEYHRFPAEYLPAFVKVTGYKEPLRVMAEMVGCYLVESEEALLAELGRIDQKKRELAAREKTIREFLARMRQQD